MKFLCFNNMDVVWKFNANEFSFLKKKMFEESLTFISFFQITIMKKPLKLSHQTTIAALNISPPAFSFVLLSQKANVSIRELC